MQSRSYISLTVMLILCYAIFRVAHLYPRWEAQKTEATISWDVYGYYLYLPATFIYGDLGQLGFKDSTFAKYQPAGDFHHAHLQDNGRYVMKYAIGMSILYAPFFLLSHGYASLSDYPADGFSFPYQFGISMGMILYAFLALFLLRRLLLRYFEDHIVAIVMTILVLATNYLNYAAIDGAMTHGPLFMMYLLILTITIEWHEGPTKWKAAVLGLLIGLATIIRPIELMTVLIPLLWNVCDKESLLQKWQLIRQHYMHVLILAGGMFVMGMIQLGYWKYSSGQWLYYSYGEDEGFHWLRPHILNGLFGFRKGWLIYTPVMALAILGFIPMFKQRRNWFWMLGAYLCLTIYVVYSWWNWWYGGGFGSRAMIQSYALWALPLACWLSYVWTRKWLLWATLLFAFLCADLNLLMTWQAHARGGAWEAEYMTKAYFWKIFGNSHPEKADKKFLDVRYELDDTEDMQIRTLYQNDFEQDSTILRTDRHKVSGQYACLLNGEHQFTPAYSTSLNQLNAHPKSWVRVRIQALYENMEWNIWQQAQLTTQFIHAGESQPYRQTTCRFQRLADGWQWYDLYYEMPFPRKIRPDDQLKVYVWNAGSGQEVFLDDFVVELIEPKP